MAFISELGAHRNKRAFLRSRGKTAILEIFTAARGRWTVWVVPLAALLTFIFSWLAIFPAGAVERAFARTLFPLLSRLAGRFADLAPFSWLDATLVAGAALLMLILWKRRWIWLINVVAALYLLFFWTWGLNYHRRALDSKLELDSTRTAPQAMAEFASRVAAEMNRLYFEKQSSAYDETHTRAEAAQRVRKVIAIIDGSDWTAAQRIKTSRIGNPWMRAAGISGVFNPLAHEPIISDTLLDVERPFVIAHELAHVRGYPHEGDANVIATFATLMSRDPAFQYSGWMNLWLYLRNRELDGLLDAGPRSDIQRVFERARTEQIRWISNFQGVILDWFLKANSIPDGVRSYSHVVLVAAASEPTWHRFR